MIWLVAVTAHAFTLFVTFVAFADLLRVWTLVAFAVCVGCLRCLRCRLHIFPVTLHFVDCTLAGICLFTHTHTLITFTTLPHTAVTLRWRLRCPFGCCVDYVDYVTVFRFTLLLNVVRWFVARCLFVTFVD